MKRAYVRPTMVGERFVANEYVAACGDSGKVYKLNVMLVMVCLEMYIRKLMENLGCRDGQVNLEVNLIRI